MDLGGMVVRAHATRAIPVGTSASRWSAKAC
jgi:hypothetical protein